MEEADVKPSIAPATPTPAFAAHLDRFRRGRLSPTSTRPALSISGANEPAYRASNQTGVKNEADSGASPAKQERRSRSRSVATPPRMASTPPRPDGSSTHFKREHDADVKMEENSTLPAKMRKKKKPSRPLADPSVYAELGHDPLPDYLEAGLDLLLCGINPGVRSAQMRQHYASPTNHFWKCLAGSGLTDRLLHPSEGPLLPSMGIGSTNLVQRPSAEMSEISSDEMKERVPLLLAKVAQFRPRVLAFVGMKICEIVLRHLHRLPQGDPASPSKRRGAMPKVKIGLQPVAITHSPAPSLDSEAPISTYIWCLPSSSARVVEYQLVDKIEIWKELKRDMDLLRAGQPPLQADSLDFTHHSVESFIPTVGPTTSLAPKREVRSPHFQKVTPIRLQDLS